MLHLINDRCAAIISAFPENPIGLAGGFQFRLQNGLPLGLNRRLVGNGDGNSLLFPGTSRQKKESQNKRNHSKNFHGGTSFLSEAVSGFSFFTAFPEMFFETFRVLPANAFPAGRINTAGVSRGLLSIVPHLAPFS